MSEIPRVRVTATAVPMRDGVELATDVVIPDGGEPRPALVLRSPYSRATSRQATDPVALARDGWAVVCQDVRGRIDSDGEFEPFVQERTDGADTIDWVASQPWCDGNVAGFGGSYLGFAQWQGALDEPPALRALTPASAGADARRDLLYEGGAFQLGTAGPWAVDMVTSGRDRARAERVDALARDWDVFFRARLADHPLREVFPPFAGWIDRGPPEGGRRPQRHLDVPAFQVAGWYDLFCEAGLELHAGMVRDAPSEYARSSQRLIVGPWTHTGMLVPMSAHFDFGRAANGMARGIPGEQMAWLRGTMTGEDVGGGIDVYVMGGWGRGEWRELGSWPPPSRPWRLFLTSGEGANGLAGDGGLVSSPPEGSGVDRFRYDPHDPVPTRGGRTMGPYHPLAGPVDQRPVEERDDVLVYTSPPLEEDVTVIGSITAQVVFATSGRSADVTVKVVDVYPDGRAFNVVDSVRRGAFTPGSPREVDVQVGSTAMRFGAGHRIRVEISSSNFPRLDRNPSTGTSPARAERLVAADQTVHHGGRAASHLTLPVTERAR